MKPIETASPDTHQAGWRARVAGSLTVLLCAGVLAFSTVATGAEITTQQKLPVLQQPTLAPRDLTRAPIKPTQRLKYQHTCPSGYHLPSGGSEAILPSAQPVTCSK